jgi:uncharacterized Zn finger protein
MKNLDVFGTRGQYGASYEDDGSHNGEHLKPCPFCGGEDLEVCNTHTAKYWVKCEPCGLEKAGEYVESAEQAQTEEQVISAHQEAFQSAVDGWNKRAN